MPVIDVDFEVWKALTTKRSKEQDGYNDVLRRLLNLGEASVSKSTKQGKAEGRPWVVKGVSFPHGTEFRFFHKGHQNLARVKEGMLVLENGEQHLSPSSAAKSITRTNINGWNAWECRLPGHPGWARMDSFRRRDAS